MSEEIIFYTNPRSRGQIARWMLEEAGAEYRTEVLQYGEEMKSERFLAINPMGKVPAIRHGEAVVTESAAICAYLADAFPQAGLAPPPGERAAYYRWLFFAAGPLEAAITNRTLDLNIPPERESMVGYDLRGRYRYAGARRRRHGARGRPKLQRSGCLCRLAYRVGAGIQVAGKPACLRQLLVAPEKPPRLPARQSHRRGACQRIQCRLHRGCGINVECE